MLDAFGGLLLTALVAFLLVAVAAVVFVAGLFRRRSRPVRNDIVYGGDVGAGAADTGWSGSRRRGDDDGGSDGGWFGGSDGGGDGGGGGGGD